MLLIIGILIIPIIIFIIKKSNMIITRKNKILFNILLILISIVYIILCLLLRLEPFDFEEHYSWEYMLYNGDYLINTGVIFIFTPFLQESSANSQLPSGPMWASAPTQNEQLLTYPP